ncbi:MAG: carbohydrate porin [Candidatus Omnitrophica bacterium]|nr:carbohydrate porin [Candidatus Omnitrophota bacterium]
MKMVLSVWFSIVVFAVCLCDTAFAQTMQEEIAQLKEMISRLEGRLARQENKAVEVEKIAHGAERQISEFINYTPGEGVEIKPAGLAIGAGGTFILQSSAKVNGDEYIDKNRNASDASYSMDLEFGKTFDDYGMAFLHLETGSGPGIDERLKVFSPVNRDADDSDSGVSVTEIWYEHYFKFMPLTVTFGKIDPTAYIDTNAYANDECRQFLGSVFRNSPVIEFPDDNTAGIRAAVEINSFMDIEFISADADADWKDVFNNMFVAGQFNIKPDIFKKKGNYRVYAWLNDKNHIKWSDSLKDKERGYGLGVSVDQEIADAVGVFARYGWQDPEVYAQDAEYSLEQSWSAGVNLSGKAWGREDDVFAIAFGQAKPSGDYKKADEFKAKTENHLEFYYNYKVNENLSISPDAQVIWDPYGADALNTDKSIFIAGIRAQVDF